MIERILQVSEMQVREVMVPKSQMVSIDKDSDLEEILPVVIESGHSRFPVLIMSGERRHWHFARQRFVEILYYRKIKPFRYYEDFTSSNIYSAK